MRLDSVDGWIFPAEVLCCLFIGAIANMANVSSRLADTRSSLTISDYARVLINSRSRDSQGSKQAKSTRTWSFQEPFRHYFEHYKAGPSD
jgi:hypothetical protein